MLRAELDAIDIKILRELQRDGRITNVELAERVAFPRRLVSGVCASWKRPA